MRKTNLIILVLLLLTMMVLGCEKEKDSKEIIKINYASECASSGGIWLSKYNECEGVSQIQCTEMNGTFNECSSACRHNPKAENCIAVCVPVCSASN